MTDRVLVTSGQERFSLAACRSLDEAGYSVSVVADVTPAASHWSRHCSARHVLIDARQNADLFVDGIAEILRRTPHAVMLPATDVALRAVSARRERLEGLTRLGLPPHDVVEAATDKFSLSAAGRAAGLPTPDSIMCTTGADGRDAGRELGYPVVIKPIRTVFELGGVLIYRNGAYVSDARRLEELLGQFGTPYLIQRVQRGTVWSAAGVRTDEGIVAFALARYIRTFPPNAGNVAFAETEDPPAGLRERIDGLLDKLGWTGIWELEMIRAGDGSFYPIDFNPRLYGSLVLATRAGAPLATILCDWLLGKPVASAVARAGVRYRWEDADLRFAVRRLRERRLLDAAAALMPPRRVAHAYLRWNDPAPIVARGVTLGGAYLHNLAARGRARPDLSEPRRAT